MHGLNFDIFLAPLIFIPWQTVGSLAAFSLPIFDRPISIFSAAPRDFARGPDRSRQAVRRAIPPARGVVCGPAQSKSARRAPPESTPAVTPCCLPGHPRGAGFHAHAETEARLHELSAATGRAPEDLVDDAMAGYLAELAQVREMLDSRYGNWKNGKVKPLDGEEAFNRIRAKSEERQRS